MQPIKLAVVGYFDQSPQEICEQLLDMSRWPEFKGYGILPGIESAHLEPTTPTVIGSKIRVRNTDGSSHVEEIVEWDVARRITLRFQDFSPPLQHLATHFIEIWEFRRLEDKTEASRSMTLYPKGFLGWLLLLPISALMKRALEKNLAEMSRG